MMVNYKLTYFHARGLAEATRQIFHLEDVPFEDERVTLGTTEWTDLKPKTPFGHVPVLSVDGFEIPQSMAILRYVARKYGYSGKTPEEEAWVDAIVDQFKDFLAAFLKLVVAVHLNKPSEEREQIKKEIVVPARDEYFKILTGILEKSKSGYLVGYNLTFADLVVADNLVTLEKNGFFPKEEYSRLAEFQKKIHSLPKLEVYIATRPDTQF